MLNQYESVVPLTANDEDAGTTSDTTYADDLTSSQWVEPTGTYQGTLDKFDRAAALDDPASNSSLAAASPIAMRTRCSPGRARRRPTGCRGTPP